MRSRLVYVAFLIAILLSCSDNHTDSPLSELFSPATQPMSNPRTNPLQTYIRNTWVGGSTTATGGSNYSHIKIYGHSHANLDDSSIDRDFIVDHFDMYMWGGPLLGTENGDMLWLHEAGHIPSVRTGYDSLRVSGWIGPSAAATCIHGNPRPGNNADGYGWDDLLLLYKYNTTNGVSAKLGLQYIPGWNPADDTDGDKCIEPGEGNGGQPSDPNRSAQDYWDARVRIWAGVGKYWMLEDVTSPASIAFTADEAFYEFDTWGVEGFHFDEAAYQVLSLGFTNTFKYEGLSENSPLFPYQTHKVTFVPSVMADAEVQMGGNPTVAIANMVNANYLCNTFQHDTAEAYLENILLENWIAVDATGIQFPADKSKRAELLECTTLDFLGASKGIVFSCLDPGDSDRGKLFTLGMFYLVNHQMAFYYYRVFDHDGHDAEETQWNPWVAYDVGQPVVNNLGYLDFQGQSGTNRFFVFSSHADYEILGRQYLRSDGKRVLVLVKLMASGKTEGNDPTTHALGGSYRKVLPSLGLGSVITQVTLTNNNAVILVKETAQGCPPDCPPEG